MKAKRRVDIAGHLILPFGTATKADINRIHLVRVAADGVRLESDVPVVHIVKSKKKPLRLAEFHDAFGEKTDNDFSQDEHAGLAYMCAEIKRHNPKMTRHEDRFLDLYFEQIAGHHFSQYYADRKKPGSVYSALMPIPEMQIYVADPLDDNGGYEPTNNFRVDYGFWDGRQLRAVEIDGAEPEGYARDVRRDRMLRRGGVDVIHILNAEIDRHDGRALRQLLPWNFWGSPDEEVHSPFDGIPF